MFGDAAQGANTCYPMFARSRGVACRIRGVGYPLFVLGMAVWICRGNTINLGSGHCGGLFLLDTSLNCRSFLTDLIFVTLLYRQVVWCLQTIKWGCRFIVPLPFPNIFPPLSAGIAYLKNRAPSPQHYYSVPKRYTANQGKAYHPYPVAVGINNNNWRQNQDKSLETHLGCQVTAFCDILCYVESSAHTLRPR